MLHLNQCISFEPAPKTGATRRARATFAILVDLAPEPFEQAHFRAVGPGARPQMTAVDFYHHQQLVQMSRIELALTEAFGHAIHAEDGQYRPEIEPMRKSGDVWIDAAVAADPRFVQISAFTDQRIGSALGTIAEKVLAAVGRHDLSDDLFCTVAGATVRFDPSQAVGV